MVHGLRNIDDRPVEAPASRVVGADLTKRIAELEAALRPFAAAAMRSVRSDKYYKILRAPDESVGILVDKKDLTAAINAIETR